jgi:hypothetical protein
VGDDKTLEQSEENAQEDLGVNDDDAGKVVGGHRDGGDPTSNRKAPGRTEYDNLAPPTALDQPTT